jgi:hypothetical protein
MFETKKWSAVLLQDKRMNNVLNYDKKNSSEKRQRVPHR